MAFQNENNASHVACGYALTKIIMIQCQYCLNTTLDNTCSTQ